MDKELIELIFCNSITEVCTDLQEMHIFGVSDFFFLPAIFLRLNVYDLLKFGGCVIGLVFEGIDFITI